MVYFLQEKKTHPKYLYTLNCYFRFTLLYCNPLPFLPPHEGKDRKAKRKAYRLLRTRKQIERTVRRIS